MFERDFKKNAFGIVKEKIKARHGFKPDKLELIKPLETGKMKFFCSGCGVYHIFSKEAVDELKELIPNFPEDHQKYFLETGSCSACDSENKSVSRKKISEL